MDMPQKEDYENEKLMEALWLIASAQLCSHASAIRYSICSAPQTWQTDAHRLMRDRHRRHILNRLRLHNKDANAVKTKRTTL
jgi:hypothetical protein